MEGDPTYALYARHRWGTSGEIYRLNVVLFSGDQITTIQLDICAYLPQCKNRFYCPNALSLEASTNIVGKHKQSKNLCKNKKKTHSKIDPCDMHASGYKRNQVLTRG
jgi:hypothetical protein